MRKRYNPNYPLLTLFVLILLGLLATPATQAQVRPEGGISLIAGLPQGEFDQNVDNEGLGINFYGGIGLGRSPLFIGLDLGFLVYGREQRREPFSTTIPDVTVLVETDNNIFLGHFLLRFQPPSGAVQPYGEGLFGLKHFFTQTRIKNDDDFFNDEEPIAESTNFDDTALSYGVGGGLKVQVYRGPMGRRNGAVMLQGGVRYLFGTEAEYLQEGSIRRSAGRVSFDITRSETNILIIHLGATIRF